jgi:hypothetical protein
MEATYFSQTSVDVQRTTWRYILDSRFYFQYASDFHTPVGNSGVFTKEFSSLCLPVEDMAYLDSQSRWTAHVYLFV